MCHLTLREELFDLIKDTNIKSICCRGLVDVANGPIIFKTTKEGSKPILVDIINIEFVPFVNLSQSLANSMGFGSLRGLRDSMKEIYGPIEDAHLFTVITWK